MLVMHFLPLTIVLISPNRSQMDQPMFGMPGQKYYLVPRDDKMLQAYEELIMGVAKLQGLANPDTIEREVKEIVDFEILLANVSL